MKLVMFDIDGTLTRTNEIDELCFSKTMREVFGFTGINTDWAAYSHCTDSGIFDELMRSRLGRSPLAIEVSAAQACFVSLLSAAAASTPFGQIPGAGEFVSGLISDPDSRFAVSLASGGWERCARLKLKSAALQFPDLPAAFSDDALAREEILGKSLAKAAAAQGLNSFEAVIYVGDGVWDARACRKLGLPFIGIADTPAKAERLFAEGARRVFNDYRDKASIMAVLEVIEP
jgi:phosphoglycolate phosphatase-like HAD superfamily hydrolase